MRRFTVAVGAVALLSLLQTRPAGSQVALSSAEIKTPLHLMGPGGTLMVSAVETLEDALPIDIEVRFFDGHDGLVKEVRGTFGPGQPKIVPVTRAELQGTERFAAVRAVVKLSRPDGFSTNQAAVSFERFDKDGAVGFGGSCVVCPREDHTLKATACLKPRDGRGPETIICPDGSAFVSGIEGPSVTGIEE